jgi:hypothetical protein
MRLFYARSSEHCIQNYHPVGFLSSLPSGDTLSQLLEENKNRLLGVPKRINLAEIAIFRPTCGKTPWIQRHVLT